jgi:two-component system sensor histidine kinase KdpD
MRGRAWIGGALALALVTALLYSVREALDKAHVALMFLLVVLGGSAAGGRTVGIVLALASFFLFDVLFLPPYNTVVVSDPLDWLVLVAYLVTSIVAAQLLARAQREAARAQQRAAEVDRLAALGADTLSAPRAEDALSAIARVIRETLGVSVCEVLSQPVATHEALVQWVAQEGRAAWRLDDGTTRTAREGALGLDIDAPAAPRIREALYPLRVRDAVVGVLRLADVRGVALDPTRQRYLDALAHYAALGVERLRLAGEAEHAAALREADRIKDALLAAVSHDLRTPLTTIRGLAHDIATDGDERGVVIEDESMRLNTLVSDLLDLSRLNAGGVPLDVALNTADDLMGAALQRVSGQLGGRDLRASIDPADPLLVGRFDLGHSLRIVGNLLENALKYAPADAPIDFTVRRDGAWLAFEVADRGPGVSAAERDRIFQPFYRAPDAPADVTGVGLGLAIARGLAEAQGGSLTVHERPGGGSVFCLRVPSADLPVS